MKENRNYYKKKIYLALLIITFILGFVSLYEYYSVTIHNPFRLLSTVLYGVIKLFLFTPPISTDDKTSLLYEIAKWLAPILTSTFIFTKISNTLLHIKNIWFNKISANHILVFENSVMGETLINNLIDDKNSYKISLISKHFIDDNLKSKYEKKGVATYQIDFEKSDKNEIREFLNTVNINNVKYMFFCSDTDLENYALYINVIKRIKPQRHIGCYIKCESNTVSSYIEDMIVYEREKKENLKKIDTTHFNQTDLTVRKIMCESLVNESISKSMDSLSSMGDIISAERIDENIKRMHIVLIGINELTDTLLKFIANDMTTKLTENTLISIMDYDADTKIEKLFAENIGLKKTLDFHITDFNKVPLYESLRSMKERPSLIFLMNEDVVKSLKYLNIINKQFIDVAKIIRNVSNIDLTYALPKDENIKLFGDVSQIMTSDILIREALDNHAKKFNNSYNEYSQLLLMGGGSSWNELSYVKKSSSRLSAMHARVKEDILRKIFFDKSDDFIKNYLNKKFEEFKKLEEIMKTDNEKFKTEFREFLKANPVLDFLSRLEHKRWCNSYYTMNFVYGEKKDENLKTHPCLIDDWNRVLGDKFDVCHPEYDLLSVFTLFLGEDNNGKRKEA